MATGAPPGTDEETGPGVWRYHKDGRSFVTFACEFVVNGDQYVGAAGRSHVATNRGTSNDCLKNLDLPRPPEDDTLTFKGRDGQLVLNSGDGFTPRGGTIRINLQDRDGDGTSVGCGKAPMTENFGVGKPESGDVVQQEYFKVYAEASSDGFLTFYEFTEVATSKNTNPDAN